MAPRVAAEWTNIISSLFFDHFFPSSWRNWVGLVDFHLYDSLWECRKKAWMHVADCDKTIFLRFTAIDIPWNRCLIGFKWIAIKLRSIWHYSWVCALCANVCFLQSSLCNFVDLKLCHPLPSCCSRWVFWHAENTGTESLVDFIHHLFSLGRVYRLSSW